MLVVRPHIEEPNLQTWRPEGTQTRPSYPRPENYRKTAEYGQYATIDNPMVNRRNLMKGLGSIGAAAAAGGVGTLALTGGAAAAQVNIGAGNPSSMTNDDGDVERVFIEPTLNVNWDGMDDTVGKVRILIESTTGPSGANLADLTGWWPVYRATAWLNGTNDPGNEVENGPGTNGNLSVKATDGGWFGGKVDLYNEFGRPDYSTVSNSDAYLDGTSLGQVDEDDDGEIIDDLPGVVNGYYGAAGDTSEFDEPTDGDTNTQTVYLRYTISLHAPNSSSADGYDVPEDDIKPNSPIVMPSGDDGTYPDLSRPAWRDSNGTLAAAVPYKAMQARTEHPAIMVEHASFDVTITNQEAEAGATGSSGSGSSAADDEVSTTTETESN